MLTQLFSLFENDRNALKNSMRQLIAPKQGRLAAS